MSVRHLPVTLTARGVGFLVSAVVVGVLWRVLALQDLRYLMVLPVVMVLLALVAVCLVPPAARLRVTVDVPPGEPEAGDDLACAVTVTARFPLTVRLHWAGEGRDAGSRHPGRTTPVAASRRPTAHPVTHRTTRRGLRRVGVDRLTVTDPLGLASRRIPVTTGREVLVVPRALDDVRPDVPSPVPPGAADGPDTGGHLSSLPGTPAGSVREFRHGDTVRQIHWKQSARTGKLLVNQYDTPHRRDLHLGLVTVTDNYLSADTFETAVSATVTVADRTLADGRRVVLHCGDRDPVPCADGDEVRRELALVTHRENDGDAGTDVLPPVGTDVLVTGHVGDDLARALDRAGWPGDLLAVEDPEART